MSEGTKIRQKECSLEISIQNVQEARLIKPEQEEKVTAKNYFYKVSVFAPVLHLN